MDIRRVITGIAQGRAVFIADEDVAAVRPPLIGNEIVRLWGFDDPPVAGTAGRPLPASAAFFPPAGGMRAVLWTAPAAAVAGHAAGDEDARTVTEQLVPGMADVAVDADGLHVTSTVDLQVVLEGEVDLVLEDGEHRTLRAGDVAVVNGVRHAWRNLTDERCLLLAVFYGTGPG
jgi:mannose-6-phosphate isomerase-like protein (cupin superfamily)